MSVRVMGAVFELGIPPIDKLVLLAMADHARDDGTGCYPSVGTLARKCSMSRRGIQYALGRLESAGLLRANGTPRGGRGKTVEYSVEISVEISEKGAPRALFTLHKGRTPRQERVHPTTEKSAPGAPEPSLSVNEPSLRDCSVESALEESVQPAVVENRAQDSPTDPDLTGPEKSARRKVAAPVQFAPTRADLERAIFRRAVSSALHDSWLRSSADDVHAFWEGIKLAAAAAADSLLENRRASLGGVRTELLARAGITRLARHTRTLFAVGDFTRRVQAATAAIVSAVAEAAIDLIAAPELERP